MRRAWMAVWMQGSAPEASMMTSAPAPSSHSLMRFWAFSSALTRALLKLAFAAYLRAKLSLSSLMSTVTIFFAP